MSAFGRALIRPTAMPIRTTLEEFYKIGPGPSSSHTMGPMRITFDFHRRVAALPADVLRRATGLEVHLFGSLSATGRGHGTDRAALAGLLGHSPATCPPAFLDQLAADPARPHTVQLGPALLRLTMDQIVFEDPGLRTPHPNTMTARVMCGADILYELEYYSVGGGFIEWKGYEAPEKGRPRHPYATMAELRQGDVRSGPRRAGSVLDKGNRQ